MQKNGQKQCFDRTERQKETHQQPYQEMANRPSLMTSYGGADKYEDQTSSSSVSDTGSEQDWTSPTGAKRSRLFLEDNGYGASCSETSSASQLHAMAREPSYGPRSGADDDRRKVRRERNKMAAARCRQRRVDLTNTLIAETEALENDKVKLEKEIENLYRQTHELQFVLESHSKRCQMMTNNPANVSFSDSLTAPVDLTAVKVEKPESLNGKYGMGRPTSLSLGSAHATGSMDTPVYGSSSSRSNGTPCSLTLDYLAGRTGLTPITGLPSAAAVPSSIECLPPNHQSLINL